MTLYPHSRLRLTLHAALRRSRFHAWLYGLHAHAAPCGRIAARDGSTGVADSLARASCTPLADGGRFLATALAVGVIVECQPGRYALVTAVVPEWSAAADHLTDPPPREGIPTR
ncbi:hypothetical protein PV726_48675 [Streptomyces europaeiscabiei]|uniref:hypothetical protein n=1 Tax=Streptomyces europaeiscabiei TaxID=146819 RepID=UPI0029A0C5F8|nr:hypothetical protein [Streptomyces europaeiscabiei]MDX3697901.1 hypothetical protein [Streptomyces europaeiscabiei]